MWNFFKNHCGKISITSIGIGAVALCCLPFVASAAAVTTITITVVAAGACCVVSGCAYMTLTIVEENNQQQAQKLSEEKTTINLKTTKSETENESNEADPFSLIKMQAAAAEKVANETKSSLAELKKEVEGLATNVSLNSTDIDASKVREDDLQEQLTTLHARNGNLPPPIVPNLSVPARGPRRV